MKPFSCFCLVFVNIIAVTISTPVNNSEHTVENLDARRPRSRDWLDEVKAEARKHNNNHPTSLDPEDGITDMKARSLFSSSSSDSSWSGGGWKKMLKHARKYGPYLPPYEYGRPLTGYGGGYGGYRGNNYGGRYGGNFGGNFRLGGGFGGPLRPPVPVY